jgi:chromosome segregation ATPase
MIQELNDSVEKESALMQDQLRQFENDITELTEKFRSAANVYSPANIDDELLKCSTKKDELLAEIESNKLQLKELTEKMSFYKEQLNDTEGDIIDENTSIIIRYTNV